MSRIRVVFALLLLLAFGAVAHANTFQINYTPTSGQFCFTICFPNVGSPFSAQFTLTPGQVAVDGIYDITSSLTQFTAYTPGPGITLSLFANAYVFGGNVVALDIGFGQTFEENNSFSGDVVDNTGFRVLIDGTFNSSSSSFSSLGPSSSSSSQAGTYTVSSVVTQSPEPASLALLAAGLLPLLGRLRRRL